MRFALVAFLMLFPGWQIGGDIRTSSMTLPPRALIVRSQGLPGLRDERIIVYEASGREYLAVASTGASDRVFWQLRIAGNLVRLVVPGPTGVFAAVTHRPHGASVYAFKALRRGVKSALTGRPNGTIFGDEGVVWLQRGFRIRERDWQHRGSVQYRYVTEYDLTNTQYAERSRRRMPNYPPNLYPTPNAVFHTHGGNTVLLRLEVASTEAQREYGLMYRPSLDPDSGMVFVWVSPVQESFWMENTLIPLSVAFIGSDVQIQETQDMQAETCDLHTPSRPYQYAIEANLGYFAANGIKPGDHVTFHLSGAAAPVEAPRPPGTPVTSCGTREERLARSATQKALRFPLRPVGALY